MTFFDDVEEHFVATEVLFLNEALYDGACTMFSDELAYSGRGVFIDLFCGAFYSIFCGPNHSHISQDHSLIWHIISARSLNFKVPAANDCRKRK